MQLSKPAVHSHLPAASPRSGGSRASQADGTRNTSPGTPAVGFDALFAGLAPTPAPAESPADTRKAAHAPEPANPAAETAAGDATPRVIDDAAVETVFGTAPAPDRSAGNGEEGEDSDLSADDAISDDAAVDETPGRARRKAGARDDLLRGATAFAAPASPGEFDLRSSPEVAGTVRSPASEPAPLRPAAVAGGWATERESRPAVIARSPVSGSMSARELRFSAINGGDGADPAPQAEFPTRAADQTPKLAGAGESPNSSVPARDFFSGADATQGEEQESAHASVPAANRLGEKAATGPSPDAGQVAADIGAPNVPVRDRARGAAATPADFAVSRGRVVAGPAGPREEPAKKIVAGEGKQVTSQDPSVGTGVAKPAPTMSVPFLSPSLQHPASEYAGTGAAVAEVRGEPAATAAAEHPAVEQLRTAHEAVEVVLHAADQVSARTQKTVNLRFSVGDAALSVRVELHANEVRTTFRTDSAELRAALSHEWQSVAQGGLGGDRPFRIAPAVFSSSEPAPANGFAGDASSQSREQKSPRDGSSASLPAASMGRAASRTAPASAPAVTPPRGAALNSRHLHTVA